MENTNKNKPNRLPAWAFALLVVVLFSTGCGRLTPEEEVRQSLFRYFADPKEEADHSSEGRTSSESSFPAENIVSSGAETSSETESLSSTGYSDYISPVDFDLLHEQNEEILAWLYIPDTGISYPVLKSETDADYYLKHDSLGREAASGSLFLDDYNEADFQDPVTVIYGHRMKSGAYFGDLEGIYGDEIRFSEHREIILYLPEKECHYTVFAAVPYDKIHILYNYDFSDVAQFFVFFDNIYGVRAFNAVSAREDYPAFGERVLILSTCLQGDNTRRFLVLAKEVTEDTSGIGKRRD